MQSNQVIPKINAWLWCKHPQRRALILLRAERIRIDHILWKREQMRGKPTNRMRFKLEDERKINRFFLNEKFVIFN